ncbi:AAA domain-containing protein [Fervidobacterium ngatamarikiense]|uniref:AAA domain-containing protein n=1 Tax=Fervidobacterium ngatamarikiense TaxID=3389972 RepID=UPI0022B22031|nr:AAA domain-containing protein [Fervidobacterium pennivorans]
MVKCKRYLKKYKERLVNLSGRNRSLVMKKIYKKHSFDLYLLKNFQDNIDKDILRFLFSRNKGRIKILQDPYIWQNQQIAILQTNINNQIKEAIEKLQIADKVKLEEEKQKIKFKYQEKFENEKRRIEAQAETLITYSNSLNYLNKEILSTEKETGRYEMYIGYPFVEGCLKDETFVRAPLLLFPVKIFKMGDEWFLENILDENVMINKVLLVAFSKFNGVQLNEEIENEFDELSSLGFDDLNNIVSYLNKMGIELKMSERTEVQRFIEIKADTDRVTDYAIGELVIKPYLILGRFPIANSIYVDYLRLEKADEENELVKKLLTNEGVRDNGDTGYLFSDESEKIKEEDFYCLTELDFSQEKAVKMADSTKQLVIYGPPGTGKSQTIASIISDALSKEKKVLMVSEKRAALDVIYNRLAKINSKIVLLHDSNKDKKNFYEKVKNALENIEDNYIQTSYGRKINTLSEIKKYSERVDNNISKLEELADFLHKEREFGLSLQKMYSMSKKIVSKEDARYEIFRKFKTCNFVEAYKYDDVKSSVENILKEGVLEDYFKYKRYVSNNSMILKIREGLDRFDIDDYIDKLTSIKNDYSNAEIKLDLDEICKDKLLILYKEKQNVLPDDITALSEAINKESNRELLVKLNNGRWWSLIYWLNYSKNKKIEMENKKEYERRGQEIYKKLLNDKEKIDAFKKKFDFIRDIVVEDEYEELIKSIYDLKDLSGYIDKLIDGLSIYEDFMKTIARLNWLSDKEKNILDFVYEITNDLNHARKIVNDIEEYFILYNINKIENQEKDKITLYGKYYDLVGDSKKYMARKRELIAQYIVEKWDSIFINTRNRDFNRYKEFERQAQKKKMLWPIRQYANEFKDMLFDLFPCWLLTPETASEVLPLVNGLFDIVIFDEASQIFVENAIPAIYRGKRVVIAGDDKQLRPTSVFKVRFDDDEEYEDLEVAAALEEESLLDLAKVKYDSVHLIYHYRSKYQELINFSNYAFYGGRLKISPNVEKTDISKFKPIERIKVNGRWIKKTNIEEAEKVVELVKDILKNRKENETIGIITFNITQRDLIDEMLDNEASNDPYFEQLLLKERDRLENGEDKSLFVKNIENVQGDERDIIIFSIGYAPNENGKILANFGSLSVDGGENRLNVAISRAKKKIYVVTSIEPEELNVDSTKNNGPKLLKKYLQYAREVSNGNKEMVETILNSILDSDLSPNTQKTFDSDFEQEVYDALVERGYHVDTQVGVAGYRIDLAIYDPNTSRYILGIECDGATYHSSKSARERDIHRQRFLESRGWNIIRIWSRDWWENPQREIDEIEGFLKDMIEAFA